MRLKELCEAAGITQIALAHELRLPQKTYNHYELKDRKLPFDIVYRLTKYYGIFADYLLGFNKGIADDRISSSN
jgi:transcriptional regulator with XRE-family HTH domain